MTGYKACRAIAYQWADVPGWKEQKRGRKKKENDEEARV
jgi:hypothetical protein